MKHKDFKVSIPLKSGLIVIISLRCKMSLGRVSIPLKSGLIVIKDDETELQTDCVSIPLKSGLIVIMVITQHIQF